MIKNYSPDAQQMLARLAKLIQKAEEAHQHACMNLGTSAQVSRQCTLDGCRHAFAIASGTAVNGGHFNQLLQEAATYEPSLKIDPKEADGIRFEARGQYLGDDDIIIPENAEVEKVEGGYWVDARVWIYESSSD